MAVLDLVAQLFAPKAPKLERGGGAPANPYAITAERTWCLSQLRVFSSTYVQRLVEQLSFCEGGGQRWTRILQIQIPRDENDAEEGPSWWIVPLGPFSRSRFSDFQVRDAAGARIPLVTREQHGLALTKMLLATCIEGVGAEPLTQGSSRYERLHERLIAFYTDNRNLRKRQRMVAGEESELTREVREITGEFENLLDDIGTESGEAREKAVEDFARDLAIAVWTTHYLCWVRATPGEVVHLESSHTIRDPRHRLPFGSLGETIKAIWEGFFGLERRPVEQGEGSVKRWFYNRTGRRQRWVKWYRHFGLVPINYEFNVPTHDDTGSYYSTLQPPEHTMVTFVDWEKGNSDDPETEIDCALPSVHLANPADDGGSSDPADPDDAPVIRAYLRCVPHHHKQIVGAAALNIVIVWLLASGRLPGQLADPLQGLIIAAPSVLVAYLVRQQRHYYAHALRRSRAILWGYLVVGVAFLVAVAFSEGAGHAGSESLGPTATAAACALTITSAAILAWYLPLGHAYDRVVIFFFHQKLKLFQPPTGGRIDRFRRNRWRNQQLKGETWRAYEAAYELFARIIWGLVVLAAALAAFVLYMTWDSPSDPVRKEIRHHALLVQLDDAAERSRTSTGSRPHGPEPCASTSSATAAGPANLPIAAPSPPGRHA